MRQSGSPQGDVWLYTHWSGSDLKEIAKSALARKARWDDPTYLTRIVFDELTKGNTGEETGFGISTSISDNENPILVLDCVSQSVFEIEESQLEDGRLPISLKSAKNLGGFAKFSK